MLGQDQPLARALPLILLHLTPSTALQDHHQCSDPLPHRETLVQQSARTVCRSGVLAGRCACSPQINQPIAEAHHAHGEQLAEKACCHDAIGSGFTCCAGRASGDACSAALPAAASPPVTLPRLFRRPGEVPVAAQGARGYRDRPHTCPATTHAPEQLARRQPVIGRAHCRIDRRLTNRSRIASTGVHSMRHLQVRSARAEELCVQPRS